tara:strand:+ start:280 stop:609 length:330 start_codon:yes stop_codon:yes gene_type:complete
MWHKYRGDIKMETDINRLIDNSNLKGSVSEKMMLLDDILNYINSRLDRLEGELDYKINLSDLNDRLDASSVQTLPVKQPVYLLNKEKLHGLFADMNKQERETLMNTLID